MGQGTDRLAHPAGGGKRLAAAGSQRRLRDELLADCGKTHFQVPQRLKPCSYESTYRSAGSAAPPQTGVFRSQLMLCPATSWQKSGAVILIEAKDPCITNQLHRFFAAWRRLRMTASEI